MPGERLARIISSPHEPGVYYVDRDTWQVGNRYELQKVLGTGSFSAVCLAWDRLEGEKVALKRVGDVFASPDYAKRVLREVCIMRRLEHPNIIRLKDVFLKPSPTGKYVFRGGRLVPTSFDCYIAMEYCDQGDLFNMRGQLPEHEVRSLMWQLLSALRYLHGLNVWHRDIKTGNLLLTLAEGRRLLKVADFGSARSAKETTEAQGSVLDARPLNSSDAGVRDFGRTSFPTQSDDGAMDLDLEAEAGAHFSAAAAAQRPPLHPNSGPGGGATEGTRSSSACRAPHSAPAAIAAAAGSGLVAIPAPDGGFQPPLTSLVCTPCYRAPEVVMSRGGYSSAIDMWSAGCVFGELLQRAAYVGKASTPHLQVAPVFAITGKPLTPCTGQHYAAAARGGSASAYAELSALFAVIGTPAWACIEGVSSEAWRRYLFHIPGRAPTLHRRFGQAGEVAVDLLARMLQFDPGRRASAEEAMAHEYFAMMHMEAQMEAAQLAPQGERQGRHAGAPASGRSCRQRANSYRRSVSPGDHDEDTLAKRAAASNAAEPAPTPLSSTPPDWLPTWPPGRSSAPQRVSGTGGQAMEVVDEAGAEKRSGQTTEGPLVSAVAIGEGRNGSGAACSSLLTKRKQLEDAAEGDSRGHRQQDRAGAVGARQAGLSGKQLGLGAATGGGANEAEQPSFWQIDEPALALAALEAELASLVPLSEAATHSALGGLGPDAGAGSRAATAAQTPEALALVEECKERLRVMLERECEEHAARAALRRDAAVEERGAESSGGASAAAGSGSARGGVGSLRRDNSEGLLVGPDGQTLGAATALHGHLRPDPGQQLDPSVIGYERIPYHADAAAARLEPEKHLWAGRHGEWTESSLAAQKREQSSGTWGVTLLPPGLDEGTAAGRAYINVVRSQQAR